MAVTGLEKDVLVLPTGKNAQAKAFKVVTKLSYEPMIKAF